MYILFFNGTNNTDFPAGIDGPIFGPCAKISNYQNELRIYNAEGNDFAPVPRHNGFKVVNGVFYGAFTVISDEDYSSSRYHNPVFPAQKLIDSINAIKDFVCHGTYTYSNAYGYEVELSRNGEAARLRINGNEATAIVTEWLPIEAVEMEDFSGYEHFIGVGSYNVPLSDVMTIN